MGVFKRRKIAYYYDTDNCTYEKAGFDWRIFLRKLGAYAGSSALFCGVFYYFYTTDFEKNKEKMLMAEYQFFMGKLQQQNKILDGYEDYLHALFIKDNDLYTAILSAQKIKESTWEGDKSAGTAPAVDTNLVASTQNQVNEVLRRINILKENYEQLQILAAKLSRQLDDLPAILPVQGKLISGFGSRKHPISGRYHVHTGLDFACPMGTPIFATGNGRVILAEDENNGYGLNIDIRHGPDYETKYAHLSQVLVKPGQEVKRGDRIGYSGNSGLSTGPHLHYEIKTKGSKIDPLDFFYTDLSPSAFLKLKLESRQDNATMDY